MISSMLLSLPIILLAVGLYLLIVANSNRQIIGATLIVLSLVSAYQLFEVKIPAIIEQANTRIEEFADYDSITNQFEDTYDITVHELDGAKEVRYYDKATAHAPQFRLLSGGNFTTYYYRVKPDLSYERISLGETSFDDGRN